MFIILKAKQILNLNIKNSTKIQEQFIKLSLEIKYTEY